MAEVSSSIQDKTISNRRGLRGYWSSARTSLFWMFAIAFALRLAYILIAHTYKVNLIRIISVLDMRWAGSTSHRHGARICRSIRSGDWADGVGAAAVPRI